MMHGLRYLWAAPVTLVGLAIVATVWITGGKVQRRAGVIEAWGGVATRLLRGGRWRSGGAAMTLGHVILARDLQCMDRSRPHEHHHVRQFERWGPFLLPAYWAIGVWLRLRGRDPYLDHPFEPDLC